MTETEAQTPETNNEGQVAESLLTGGDAEQQSQEQQPQEAPVEQEQPAEPSQPEGAPESYEFQAIEGSDLAVDSAPVQAFSEVAKASISLKNKLSQCSTKLPRHWRSKTKTTSTIFGRSGLSKSNSIPRSVETIFKRT